MIDNDSRTDVSGSTTGYDYFYLSTIRSHKTGGNTDYFVTCAPENCIPLFFDGMKFNTILGEISDNSAVMGLFLPISAESNVGPTGSREWVESLDRHIIESTTDSESNDFRNVLTIAPVKVEGEHATEFKIADASININYPKISFANPDENPAIENLILGSENSVNDKSYVPNVAYLDATISILNTFTSIFSPATHI